MKKVFTLVGSTAGGSIGWAAGATIGTMTGFFLMVIGTAAGTYYGIKAAERFLP
jgi:outer membrane lipoprotein SlyB